MYAGSIGLIPRDKINKRAHSGDLIVVLGGRTGRDGIHGATFSSLELSENSEMVSSGAVQIGNAIEQKKVLDVLLKARDMGLFTCLTDCGAGGLSSAVGEMGELIGALVELDKVPLKYAGLSYTEIWISEAQERMVLSVPTEHVADVLALCASENVEATVIGTFGTPQNELILRYQTTQVGRISMEFLHHGLPMPTRKAVVEPTAASPAAPLAMRLKNCPAGTSVRDRLLAVLAHPNVASKHWIVRQYDHEVQGGSVVKPLAGPFQRGPSDAAVLRPKLDSWRGIAIACGLAPYVADPYKMALAAIDEAVRNVVAVGADFSRIALLDNFCWPSVEDPQTMGTLVRACEACYDAAREYGIPFISGKDSLHNQFTDSQTGQVIRIPSTLLISALAVLEDVRRCVTMDLKKPGGILGMVRQAGTESELSDLAETHRLLSRAIADGHVLACHDISDGGTLAAAAEMCIASGLGIDAQFSEPLFFRESPGNYLVEIEEKSLEDMKDRFSSLRTTFEACGKVVAEPVLRIGNFRQVVCEAGIEALTAAWRGTLDW